MSQIGGDRKGLQQVGASRKTRSLTDGEWKCLQEDVEKNSRTAEQQNGRMAECKTEILE
jgi:hypothetical protein